MTPQQTISKLQEKVSRLEDYKAWVKTHARHALFCARRRDSKAECGCGLAELDPRFK